jgi:hypothetical protein
MKSIFLAFLVIFYSHLASGETYKWVDDGGGVHYTDDFTKIPERYRSRAERPVVGESKEPVRQETGGPSKGKETETRDLMGRGEDYWRGRVKEVKDKIKALEEKGESLRLKFNELTTRYNDSRSSVERAGLRAERDRVKSELDQVRSEIEEARVVLEKRIPEEAESLKAKPEWVKQ